MLPPPARRQRTAVTGSCWAAAGTAAGGWRERTEGIIIINRSSWAVEDDVGFKSCECPDRLEESRALLLPNAEFSDHIAGDVRAPRLFTTAPVWPYLCWQLDAAVGPQTVTCPSEQSDDGVTDVVEITVSDVDGAGVAPQKDCVAVVARELVAVQAHAFRPLDMYSS